MAARVRPRKLGDFAGQKKILGSGTALRRAVERGQAGSLILWGPPGAGKTTLAYLIADRMKAAPERVSAVAAGVKDLRKVIDAAGNRQRLGQRTVLIVDEIHRFNKAQQDVLLPAVEEGTVTLVGATTENPYFEVIKALVSRAQVVRLEALGPAAMKKIIKRALSVLGEGADAGITLSAAAGKLLVEMSGGDARRALNVLERAAVTTREGKIGRRQVEAAAQHTVVQYDKAGDVHYDTISAFIKSLRGSDPDAALFYLFRMLAAGEDPKFIMRRMLIFASEDIGNADPHSLMVAVSAAQTLEWVGLPEAEFALAQAATYLASAPKSNSVYAAKEAAKEDVEKYGNARPPGHITNAPVEDMKKHGRGVGYKYPHDFPGHVVKQRYRPDEIQENIYYCPGEEGFEKEVKRRVEVARKLLH